jgi:hypothetical protein
MHSYVIDPGVVKARAFNPRSGMHIWRGRSPSRRLTSLPQGWSRWWWFPSPRLLRGSVQEGLAERYLQLRVAASYQSPALPCVRSLTLPTEGWQVLPAVHRRRLLAATGSNRSRNQAVRAGEFTRVATLGSTLRKCLGNAYWGCVVMLVFIAATDATSPVQSCR